MRPGLSAVKKEDGHYVQTEWGTFHVQEGLPKLGPRYDFLKEPNPRERLSKIKKEIHHAENKLRRKKKDRVLLFLLLIVSTLVVSFLSLNQAFEEGFNFKIITSLILLTSYFVIVAVVTRSLLVPANRNMKYIRIKLKFLADKKEEAKLQQLNSLSPQ
jgi:hypothetical protein